MNPAFYQKFLLIIVAILCGASLFYFIIQPARTVALALKVIYLPMPFEERGRLYQKALSLSPLGARQIRESFTNQMEDWIQDGIDAPPEILEISIREAEILIRENKGNIQDYIILGNFYNALAGKELKKSGKFTKEANDFLAKANEILLNGLELNPNTQRIYASLARTHLYIGDDNGAVDILQKAINLEPEHPESHWNLAEAYYLNKDFESAKKNFEKALELGYNINDPIGFGKLSQVYFETGEHEKAIEWYRKVVELSPGDANVHYVMAVIYRGAGYLEKAKEEAEMVKKLKPATTTIMEIDKFMSEISN